jgi:hypothetical protein
MSRLRGWASKGERLVDKVPHGGGVRANSPVVPGCVNLGA